jgi:hypothetical protein
VYYARPTEQGIWRVPLEGGAETRVLPRGQPRQWAIGASGIYILERDAEKIEFYRFGAAEPERIIRLPAKFPGLTSVIARGIGLSWDERWIFFTQLDRLESDLTLAENLP